MNDPTFNPGCFLHQVVCGLGVGPKGRVVSTSCFCTAAQGVTSPPAWGRERWRRGRRRAGYERDTLVAGVPQEVQVSAPEPSGVPQFMQ